MYTLITGGAGYIGSHTCLTLLQAGYKLIILDNFSNSSAQSIFRVSQITKISPILVTGDIRNLDLLQDVFSQYEIKSVIHFAGLKAVAESVSNPLQYYENNVAGSLTLLKAMSNAGVFEFVFSSSATVYGDPEQSPISESSPLGNPSNPYGRSKLMVEDLLRDLATSDPRWRIAILRYFNPVGAHNSGLIGEDPNGIPNNLLPFIAQVSVGKLTELSVFGDDYPTPDGTGVRDYIHVMDLAEGHLCALSALESHAGASVWNLGTGKGYSVLEMIKAFEKTSGKVIPYRLAPRRPGDVASCYADATKAKRELNWAAKRSLGDMVEDAWRWQSMNPDGYKV